MAQSIKLPVIILIFLSLLFFSGCGSGGGPGTVTVTGRVTENNVLKPGVFVSLDGSTGGSYLGDAVDGTFTIPNVVPGYYQAIYDAGMQGAFSDPPGTEVPEDPQNQYRMVGKGESNYFHIEINIPPPPPPE